MPRVACERACQPSLASKPPSPRRAPQPRPPTAHQIHFCFPSLFLFFFLERSWTKLWFPAKSVGHTLLHLDSSRPGRPHYPLHLSHRSLELVRQFLGRNRPSIVGCHGSAARAPPLRADPPLRSSSAQINPQNGFVGSSSSSSSSSPMDSGAEPPGTPPAMALRHGSAGAGLTGCDNRSDR